MRAPARDGRSFGRANVQEMLNKINQITEAFMADKFDLVAEIREDSGKGASRRLRRQNKVPAIIYGAGRPQAAIVKDIQRHPSKFQIVHMDFQRIVEDQVIRMNVPIHFVNADIAVGVKVGGGTVSTMRNDVEVVCLPRYLPEYLELDISGLELDGYMYMSDIPLPEGVEIPELAQETDQVQPIVSIHVIKEEIIEEEVEELIEGEIPAGEVPVGDEEPAEGGEGDDDSTTED
jgi:large subunit ribosomal protein L25